MIARVFPTKTNMCPDDKDAYFGEPDMFTPEYDEVHISCTFTWDIDKSRRLAEAWKIKGKRVFVGGPAVPSSNTNNLMGDFHAGMYLRKGITITTRGCPNSCGYCLVRQREPMFRELPIVEGNVVQDNNILASSDKHWRSVCKMLRKQKQIEFKGGLESRRITPKVAEELRSLRIKSLWLACDHDSAIKPLKNAVEILMKAGFKKSHLYCYVLVGKEEQRLREVFDVGCMPFAQLYQPPLKKKIEYTPQAKQWQRTWCRPAAYKSWLKKVGE